MNSLHLEDQVSSDFLFGRSKAHMLHLAGDTLSLTTHQVVSGMEPGEFARRREDAWNHLNVQCSLASVFVFGIMAFRPSDSVLKAIISAYQRNSVCSVLENRTRLDEIPALRLPIDCSLEVDLSQHNTPIFTRHPRTGDIVHHSYPYATLPRFTLPSTDPGLLGIAAYTFDRTTADYRDPCSLDIVQKFREIWDSDKIDEHCKLFHYRIPTPPSSPLRTPRGKQHALHKRRRVDDDQVKLSKRTSIAAAASTPRKRSRRVDSKRTAGPSSSRGETTGAMSSSLVTQASFPLIQKRKRLASQVHDCLSVQLAPSRKRPRKDLIAVGIPARTVYERAAKSKGRLL
ncbi:hypothetical protein CYLTODRAFT_489440 [Cylindrobasidium torrendii FP15055 ss-10]|uniref:Uncharacterized protein n=1 Tax=Cylindrobasidium torrendii FP15055 ss-10 TaxID=1314674 RepID=A0A0D7BF32_9AGAR|nr:hypothetical protein CYLTODRAFT_489440 [Cylindrobasidium torrendii FP15055 ss-10]